tara:strand:+ start:144 stop:572 length:429 start_codon:yes stop_codon:yes gene_type:complete
MINIKEDKINDVVIINQKIPEFDHYSKDYFTERIKDSKNIILVAYINNSPIGYLIAYDRFKDNSIYCWMAGVDSEHRKQGVLTALMNYLEKWAKNDYNKIKIKTRNCRREMLFYLIKNNFMCTKVEPFPDIKDNRIWFEKKI